MTKVNYFLMMAAAASLCLVSCKGKGDKQTAEGEGDAATTEQTQEATATQGQEEATTGLEDYYSICPFLLQDQGKVDADGNPVTVNRTWVCGGNAGVGTFADWVLYSQAAPFNFNVDGWHYVGRDIVNADETYKIVADDVNMSMSSYCIIRTEKYQKPSNVEEYEPISWNGIYTVNDDAPFELSGLKLIGNRHSYTDPEQAEYAKNEELTERVQTSFYLNEYITVTLPADLADQDITLVALPLHHTYEGVSINGETPDVAWTGKPELNEGRLQAEFYINIDLPVGLYDLLFVSAQKPYYRVTLALSKEAVK